MLWYNVPLDKNIINKASIMKFAFSALALQRGKSSQLVSDYN